MAVMLFKLSVEIASCTLETCLHAYYLPHSRKILYLQVFNKRRLLQPEKIKDKEE